MKVEYTGSTGKLVRAEQYCCVSRLRTWILGCICFPGLKRLQCSKQATSSGVQAMSCKSPVTGFLWTLLLMIFEQMPEVLPKVVPPRKWQIAGLEGKHNMEWTEPELLTCLKHCASLGGKDRRFSILVDGLDEIEGPDESRTDLLDLILDLASTGNIKICLSSRPWTIFNEAFGNCPQLKLEYLTHSDIGSYVTGQLHGNRRRPW